jgi:hypothetical protein
MAVLLTAIAAEAVGHNPQPFTKALILGTLALAWLFSNTICALHCAHPRRHSAGRRLLRLRIPGDGRARLSGLCLFCFHLRHAVHNLRR